MIIESDEFLAALGIDEETTEEETPRPRTPRPVSEIGECNLCGFEKNVFFDLCPPDYHVEARMCRECFDCLREMETNQAETTNWIKEGF